MLYAVYLILACSQSVHVFLRLSCLPCVFYFALACSQFVHVFLRPSCSPCVLYSCLFTCFRGSLGFLCSLSRFCLFIVCAYVSGALMLSLCTLSCSFLDNFSCLDSKVLPHLIASFLALHCAFLFDGKTWPHPQTDLLVCNVVLHCDIPFSDALLCIEFIISNKREKKDSQLFAV